MADLKISQLTGATTPLAGTEVVPLVQSSATKKVAVSDLTAGRDVSVKKLITTDNIGVGGSPANWAAGSGIDVSAWAGYGQGGSGEATVLANAYYDGSNYRYKITALKAAGLFVNPDGGIQVKVSTGSATAGAAFSWADVVSFTNDQNITVSTAAKGVNFTANTPAAGMTSQLLNWYEEGTWTPNQGGGLTVVGAFSSAGTYTRIGRQVFIRGSVSGATSVAVAIAGAISTNLPYSSAADTTGAAINAANDVSSVIRVSSATLTAATAIAATATITFSAVYSV